MTPRPTSTLRASCALALAAWTFAAVAEPLPGDADTECSAPAADVSRALMRATNEARAEARRCGTTLMPAAPAVRLNSLLNRAARAHSRDMARNNFFSHTGSDGSKSWDRAAAQGYVYGYIGENIAAGYRDAGSVQSGWLNSPGHCENIMRPQYTQMGVGCTRSAGSDYGTYWTVVFGRPR